MENYFEEIVGLTITDGKYPTLHIKDCKDVVISNCEFGMYCTNGENVKKCLTLENCERVSFSNCKLHCKPTLEKEELIINGKNLQIAQSREITLINTKDVYITKCTMNLDFINGCKIQPGYRHHIFMIGVQNVIVCNSDIDCCTTQEADIYVYSGNNTLLSGIRLCVDHPVNIRVKNPASLTSFTNNSPSLYLINE